MHDELRRELLTLGAAGAVALGGAALYVHVFLLPGAAVRWLLQSLAGWALAWWLCWRNRSLNRQSDTSPLLPALGSANRLTLLRGWLIAGTGGFLGLLPAGAALPLLPALLYTSAAVADRADGWVARRSGSTTLLGATLDTQYDALGLVIAPLLAISLERLHPSYLLVSVAYYVFIAGFEWRRRQGLPVHALLPSPLRRTLAGMQMGVVATVLWPPLNPAQTQLTGALFMLPLLLGFLVDWGVVSTRIAPQGAAATLLYQQLPRLTERWLLPAVRLVALAALLHGLPPAIPVPALGWLAAAAMITGLAARVGAAVLLVLLSWHSVAMSDNATLVLHVATTAVLLLGSGSFSAWQGDGRWIARQDGG